MTKLFLKKVFHIDDDRFIRQLVEFVFDESDVELQSLASGTECLDLLKTFEDSKSPLPSLILLDANLEDMDGVDLAYSIYDKYPEILVVFVTSTNEKQLFNNRARPPNTAGLVKKPFAPDDLLVHLDDLINQPSSIDTNTNLEDGRFENLRLEYIGHLKSQKQIVIDLWRSSISDIKNSDYLKELLHIAHKTCGTSALHQLEDLSIAARNFEEQLIEIENEVMSVEELEPAYCQFLNAIESSILEKG